jgi:hypothetical protein
MYKHINNPNILLDEINFLEVYKNILQYKTFIFIVTIVFTFSAYLYSNQKLTKYNSTIFMHMGNASNDNSSLLVQENFVESASDLIVAINMELKYFENLKLQLPISVSAPNKLIAIFSTVSISQEDNIITLELLRDFIINRHTIANRNSIADIKNSLSQIDFQINGIVDSEILLISNRIPIINSEVLALEKLIKNDEADITILKLNAELQAIRASQYPSFSEVIFNHKTSLNELILEKKHLEKQMEILNNYKDSDLLFALDIKFETIISSLLNRKKILAKKLGTLENISINITSQIGNIQTSVTEVNKSIYIFIGIILGLLFSIFLIFTMMSFKKLKE